MAALKIKGTSVPPRLMELDGSWLRLLLALWALYEAAEAWREFCTHPASEDEARYVTVEAMYAESERVIGGLFAAIAAVTAEVEAEGGADA